MNGEHKISDGSAPKPLLTESNFRALLGGMSERKFKSLRAEGVIPAPLELGPRVPRWTHDLAKGTTPTDAMRERLQRSAARILVLRDEVHA